ncbi:claudin-4-like [Brienomyrus brachyistius]|uniref:claudin-4-like n=1 Tax=Brienomyrus brachyistius TaxID=42636 RepID=UPI0020B30F55|nr:claudin-4-like [Brienomyrus brachyistius]
MASAGLQIFGITLAAIGWLGDIVICALPQWKVTAFIGSNIVTAQTVWEGLWLNCVVQSTGQMQCKVYDSMLALPQDLQAARALVVISILVAIFGILLSIAGGRCTNCIEEGPAKAKVALVAGIFFIGSGILCLIPVCWSANTIIRDFYNPLVTDAQRRELDDIGMGRVGKEIAGQVICFIGLVGVCLCCGLPMWRVTSYVGANIVTGQIVWDGLWMGCVMQATGQMQCMIEDSIMSLSPDLQAARALVVISMLIAFLSFALSFLGAQCTSCLKKESSQAKVVILSGIFALIAGVICLIPTCWSAVTTVSDFESPMVIQLQKREIGAAVYIGWGAAGLLLIGGSFLCSSCPPHQPVHKYPMYPPMYQPYPGSVYSGSYVPTRAYYSPAQYVPNKSVASAPRPHGHEAYL